VGTILRVIAARLVLVRHGESEWNAEHRLQGQADPALSEAGRRQGEALRALLEPLGFERAVTSDLGRSVETARLAGHPEARHDPRWREIALGDWTGKLEAEVSAEELAAFRHATLVPPSGESWPIFQARVASAVEALGREGGDWLVFTHGGPVRAAVAHVTHARPEAIAGPANASITVLELAPRRRLLVFNRSSKDGLPRPSEPGGA
jgi:glucosyl-3-phosphoglycerate phosphatase